MNSCISTVEESLSSGWESVVCVYPPSLIENRGLDCALFLSLRMKWLWRLNDDNVSSTASNQEDLLRVDGDDLSPAATNH